MVGARPLDPPHPPWPLDPPHPPWPLDRPHPPHALDNPVRASLLGAHQPYAVGLGNALAYRPDYSPFMALPDAPSDEDWGALARLVGVDGVAVLFGATPPVGWVERRRFSSLQMVARPVVTPVGAGPVVLGPDDLTDVLDLVARTEPGPFLPRTMELGRFLGLREDRRLLAMAGERMRVPGWTEVSAVCTDPVARGRGLAGRLVRGVMVGAGARGDGTFLHVMATNGGAVRLYESLGFTVRRPMAIVAVSPPPPPQPTTPTTRS